MTSVLITCPQMRAGIGPFESAFAERGIAVDLPDVQQAMTEDQLLEIIDRYDGVIAGDDNFTALVLERGRRLRVISKWGVGTDGIDSSAAARLGITVTNTPGVFHSEVADVCIGYLIMLARELHRIDSAVRSGQWLKIAGVTLAGRTLGIVGLGSIGMAVARRAQAMEMLVLGFDRDPRAIAAASAAGIEVVTFGELIARVDALSLNCPLTPSTFHLIDTAAFAAMRDGVLIINTARGPVVDEAALLDALSDGRVGGAALDVFEHEPLTGSSPLLSLPNVILGSHNSSNTTDAVQRVSSLAVRNLLQYIDGRV